MLASKPRTASRAAILGMGMFTAGIAFATVVMAWPWYYAAIGFIPFGAPWPPGYLIGDTIVVAAGTITAAMWVGILRTVEDASRRATPRQGPW